MRARDMRPGQRVVVGRSLAEVVESSECCVRFRFGDEEATVPKREIDETMGVR